MKTKLLGMLGITLGVFLFAGAASAADADLLQPASDVTYNETLVVNDTGKFDSIYVGKQDVGGVTFFNGTIVNSTTGENDFNNPVTFGDDLRFDGKIYRVEEGGDNHLKIADTMIPASDHDLGTSDDRWGNVWAAGANFSEAVTIQGGEVWTSENDGSGSGLNADKLDGKSSGYFAKKSNTYTKSESDNRYYINNTKTRYWSVSADDFQPEDESNTYTKTSGTLTNTSGKYTAPIHLPHGAKIKYFRFYYKDSSFANNMDFKLTRYIVGISGNPIGSHLCNFSTSGTSGSWKKYECSLSHTVDNSGSWYSTSVDFDAASLSLIIGGVEIEYTVDQPLP